MTLSAIRSWWHKRQQRRRAAGAVRGRGARPALELLEDRTLLSGGVGPILPTLAPTPVAIFVQKTIVEPDGKILEVGTALDPTKAGNPDPEGAYSFATAQFNSDGSLDTSFGNGGEVITSLNNAQDRAQDALVQPDGKIVVVGWADAPYIPYNPNSLPTQFDLESGFGLVRYNADGSLDTSFGTGGTEVVTFDGFNSAAYGVALQGDGKLVVAGTSSLAAPYASAIAGQGESFTVARFNADGSLDTGFAQGGVSRLGYGTQYPQFGYGSENLANAVTINPDGTILVQGESDYIIMEPLVRIAGGTDGPIGPSPDQSYTQAVSVLYNPDGSLDQSFGDGGILISPVQNPLGPPVQPGPIQAPPPPVLIVLPSPGEPAQTPANGGANTLPGSPAPGPTVPGASAGFQFVLAPTVEGGPGGSPTVVIDPAAPVQTSPNFLNQAPPTGTAIGTPSAAYRSGGGGSTPFDQTTDPFSLPTDGAPAGVGVPQDGATTIARSAPNAVLDAVFTLLPLGETMASHQFVSRQTPVIAVSHPAGRPSWSPAPLVDGPQRSRSLGGLGFAGLGLAGGMLGMVGNEARRRKGRTISRPAVI